MFGRDSRSNARIDTLVGKSAKVAGDVEFTGGLHLDAGRVAGNVRADNDPTATLSVERDGRHRAATSSAQRRAETARSGATSCARDRVVLGATARVQGNVHYGVIEMTLGAEIKGKLVPLPTGCTRHHRGVGSERRSASHACGND